ERTFGPARMFLFVLVSAFVSSGLQSFDGPGIGLSGVGYALFGFGWVGRRRYPEFARVVNERTIQMFVLWGAICVVATQMHIMNIGNVAHLSGLLFGATTAGLMLVPTSRLALTGALALMATGSFASLFWNPHSPIWVGEQALKAERKGDFDSANTL